MTKKVLISVFSFIAGVLLLYLGLKFFLTPEELRFIVSQPLRFHFWAFLLVVPTYLFGGVQTFILLRMMYKRSISAYDIITLPFVIGLWGFLIPFQGSYLYNSIYFKAKYKISIINTTSISLVSLSVSLLIAGILGMAYSYFAYWNPYFLILSILLLVHPVFIFALLKIVKQVKLSKYGYVERIADRIEIVFNDYLRSINVKNIAILIAMNLVDTFGIALWIFWVSTQLGFDLSFFQLLMLQFFMKITILFKFTPGNLGVNQFASSAIILLVGGTIAEGFTLSLYQSAISVIAAFTLGSVFSVVNMKHFFNKHPA